MNPGYFLREGFSGLFRAKLATFVAVTIICIALSLVGFFLVVALNLNALVTEIRSRVELEVFLDKSLDEPPILQIGQALRRLEGVDSVIYVSRADAARVLKEVMGDEDIFDLVETNPLPPSYRLRLVETHRNLLSVEAIAAQVESWKGVDEVNYQKELLRALDEKAAIYNQIVLGTGILAALAAIFLTSNTIKLSIYSKRDLVRTMKLVGATNGFISGPFVVEGLLQGLFGGLLAAGVTWGVVWLIRTYVIDGLTSEYLAYGILTGGGALLGLMGSFLAIRFFLKEKISDR